MKAVLDTCVLYPTLLREILLGCAGAGLFAPLWSEHILEEWRRAVLRRHPEQAGAAEAEIAAVAARFPNALVAVEAGTEAGLSLPDENDRHVLACGVDGGAKAVVTLNLRDFPGRTLARLGIVARSPDSLMLELLGDTPAATGKAVAVALADLRRATGAAASDRALLKRAGLPRLAKALSAAG